MEDRGEEEEEEEAVDEHPSEDEEEEATRGDTEETEISTNRTPI